MIKTITISIVVCLIGLLGYSQDGASDKAKLIAHRMAKVMQDSLNLSAEQRLSLFEINIGLHNEKMEKRREFSASDSLLTIQLQRVENKRDSLYKVVLNNEKYLLYKQMKRNLVSRNGNAASDQ